jgi:hypothetical protein
VSEQSQTWLNDVKRVVDEMNDWADDKIASDAPPSPAEVEMIKNVMELLKKLKQRLQDMKK